MRIRTLTLQNFRNYEDETFTFDEGINVLYGRNAQGKTNCAEAVFYLCTGTSPRARKDRQMIRAGQESARIAALADTRFGSVRIEADIFENRREIRINGSRIARNADLLGNIDGVFFSPGELRIVQDGPEERRRFLNVSLSQMSRSYYTALIRYNKILEQRNALLKNRDLSLVFETLPVWDVQLCRYAAEIVRRRGEYIAMLSLVNMVGNGQRHMSRIDCNDLQFWMPVIWDKIAVIRLAAVQRWIDLKGKCLRAMLAFFPSCRIHAIPPQDSLK